MREDLRAPILGLDVGQVRIGIALSDPLHLTAQPHSVLARKSLEDDLDAIEQLARQHAVDTIIVGWPRTLRGKVSESTREAEAFAAALRRRLSSVVIELWDERLTTVQAEAALLEADMRRKKRKQTMDKIAAALMLQSYLDHRRNR